MMTLELKHDNKSNFSRALKELKRLSVWECELTYSPASKTWIVKYNTDDQLVKIKDKMDYGWNEVVKSEKMPICPKCKTVCYGDCK